MNVLYVGTDQMLYNASPLSIFRVVFSGYRLSFSTFVKTWYLSLLIMIMMFCVILLPAIIKLHQTNPFFNFSNVKSAIYSLFIQQSTNPASPPSTTKPVSTKLIIEKASQIEAPAIYEQSNQRMRIERIGAPPSSRVITAPPPTQKTEPFTQKLTTEITKQLQQVETQTHEIALPSIDTIVTEVIYYALSIYLWIMVLYRAHHVALDIKSTASSALGIGLKRLPKSIAVTILPTFILTLLAIFLLVITYLLFLLLPPSQVNIMIIFIIDMLIMLWLSLYLFLFPMTLVITENLPTIQCITLSWGLVWGNWWRAITIIVLSTVILFFAILLFFLFLLPSLIKLILMFSFWLFPKMGIPIEWVMICLLPFGYALLYGYCISLGASLNLTMLNDFRLRQFAHPAQDSYSPPARR